MIRWRCRGRLIMGLIICKVFGILYRRRCVFYVCRGVSLLQRGDDREGILTWRAPANVFAARMPFSINFVSLSRDSRPMNINHLEGFEDEAVDARLTKRLI